MLMGTHFCRKNTGRAFARPAGFFHSYRRPFNISIRAKFGESTLAKQSVLNFTIDKWPLASNIYAIEWSSVNNNLMNETGIMDAIETHRRNCPAFLEWFAGVRITPRAHPRDGQELRFPTRAWVDIQAGTTEEAQRIAEKLFELGYGISPIHTNSASAKHIFAYAIKTEKFN
jgi:hypothetical protein